MEIVVVVGLLMFFGLPVVLMSELTPENIHNKTGLSGVPKVKVSSDHEIFGDRIAATFTYMKDYKHPEDISTIEMEQKLADMRAGIARIMGHGV